MINSYKTEIYSHEHGWTVMTYDRKELVKFTKDVIVLNVPEDKTKVLVRRINEFSELYNLGFHLKQLVVAGQNRWLVFIGKRILEVNIIGELKIERTF